MNVHRAIVEVKSCAILGFCYCPEEQYKMCVCGDAYIYVYVCIYVYTHIYRSQKNYWV